MKKMILMRGIPGSGKSTRASEIVKERGGVICSTDNYFIDCSGRYNFNPARIGAAHAWNRQMVRAQCDLGKETIIVDNTNTTEHEMRPYKEMAGYYGYEVEEIVVGRESLIDGDVDAYVAMCHARCTHNVPLDTIKKMANRLIGSLQ